MDRAGEQPARREGVTEVTTFTIETVDPQITAAIQAEVPVGEIRELFDRAFPVLVRSIAAQGVEVTGPPFAYYPRMPGETIAVVIGFPVDRPVDTDGEVGPFELPGGQVVSGTHVGSYDTLAESYHELVAWSAAEGHHLGEAMWEIYLTDPEAQPDPDTWRTRMVWPLRG